MKIIFLPRLVRWLAECCCTSTETAGLLGTGAQDGHLDFHTAPELWSVRKTESFSCSTRDVSDTLVTLNWNAGKRRGRKKKEKKVKNEEEEKKHVTDADNLSNKSTSNPRYFQSIKYLRPRIIFWSPVQKGCGLWTLARGDAVDYNNVRASSFN